MKSVFTEEYDMLLQSLITARKAANLTQSDLAKALAKPQSFVSKYERKERRLDVIEYISVCRLIGLNPCDEISKLDDEISTKQRVE